LAELIGVRIDDDLDLTLSELRSRVLRALLRHGQRFGANYDRPWMAGETGGLAQDEAARCVVASLLAIKRGYPPPTSLLGPWVRGKARTYTVWTRKRTHGHSGIPRIAAYEKTWYAGAQHGLGRDDIDTRARADAAARDQGCLLREDIQAGITGAGPAALDPAPTVTALAPLDLRHRVHQQFAFPVESGLFITTHPLISDSSVDTPWWHHHYIQLCRTYNPALAGAGVPGRATVLIAVSGENTDAALEAFRTALQSYAEEAGKELDGIWSALSPRPR
jgi:hypothetical protein